MKNRLCTWTLAVLALAGAAQAQVVSYSVANETGCATGTGFVAPNATAMSLCRGPGITWNTAGNSYNSRDWTVGGDDAAAVANNDYLSFGVTIDPGFKATFTDIVIRAQRSNTGPQSIAIRSSLDNFATTIATATGVPTSASNVTLDFQDFEACGAVEFRLYGWGGTNIAGTLRAQGPTDAIVINGAVSAGNCGAPVLGACCIGTNCTLTATQADCTAQSGFWGGEGTSCPSFVCPTNPTGACCFGDGTCQVLTSADCSTAGGAYTTDNLACAAANCPQPVGACCINGVCNVDATEADCSAFAGVWGGIGTTCGTFQCPASVGPCCIAGNCTLTTEAECAGSWTIGASCAADSCPAVGACCVGGNCTPVTFGECSAASGVWLGKGVACSEGACVRPALPENVIGRDDFDLQRDATSFVIRRVSDQSESLPAWIPGQMFGIGQRFRVAPENLPFGVLDDTLSVFPGDVQGIVSESKVDSWFGVVNLYPELAGDLTPDNPTQNGDDELEAVWTFNITGRTNLALSVQLAAMGDFEAITCSGAPNCVVDRYTFAVSIDGGPFTDIFAARADEALDHSYTLANGSVISAVPDPLVVDGEVLDNVFTTFSKNFSGTGSVLTVRLRAQTDGNTEAFAFDNLEVLGDTGSTQTPCQKAASYAGDLNLVEVGDLFNFLDLWFLDFPNGAPTVAQPNGDFDGDSDVDVSDLFQFLDEWFAAFGNGGNCN